MAQTEWIRMYRNIPIITKYYTTATFLVTAAVNLELISEYSLYFNPYLIIARLQIWRLVTPFLFAQGEDFGFFGTLFELFFRYNCVRLLENGSFYKRPADCIFSIIIMAVSILIMQGTTTDAYFLGDALRLAIFFLWSRRNGAHGMFAFQMYMFFAGVFVVSKLLNDPVTDGTYSFLVGYHASHLYYFLEDVFPKQPMGFRILKTPEILMTVFGQSESEDGPRGRRRRVL